MTLVRIAAVILLFASCTPKPQTQCGFVQNVYGENIKWTKPLPIKVNIHISDLAKVEAVQRAGDRWNAFIYINGEADINVYELEHWDDGNNGEQGRTSVLWAGNSIIKADIKINLNQPADLESLMLHEFGHSLGLGHKSNTVMNPILGTSEIRRELTSYELNALKCGYGN